MNITPPGSARDIVRSRALLSDRNFGSLWLAQSLAQTGSNAILFALLVVILDITGSSIHTSLLVLSFILPSIPLGIVVGVVLDRVNKGPVLLVTSLIRAGCCLLFFFFHTNTWGIYGISFAFSTAGLFFNPAVVALIPSLVSRERLVSANSLYNFTLTGSQLAGIVFLAPIILKTIHADGMFLTAAVMFTAAAAFSWRLRTLPGEREVPGAPVTERGAIHVEFRESWRAILADRRSTLALSQLIMSSTLVLLFAILIPRYMKDILGVPPDNSAFVFAPTGIGALVGLRFLPSFTRRGKNRSVVIGLVGIHERAPADMRGRIFATQVISANFISLLPLFVFGAVTDWLHVTVVLLLISIGLLAMAALSHAVGREGDEEEAGEPPGEGRGRPEQAPAQVPAAFDTSRGVR